MTSVCSLFGCIAAVCSGEITDSAGVVLSPNWPEAYDKGQDCIWGIHVEEDKRIMLDIQVYVKVNDIFTHDPTEILHSPFTVLREICIYQPGLLFLFYCDENLI